MWYPEFPALLGILELSSALPHVVLVIPGIMRNSWTQLLPIWYRELPALWGILELSSCPFGTGNSRHYEEFFSWAFAHLVLGITGIMRNSLAELLPIWYRELPALWGIYKISKNIDRTLFWLSKIKTRSLRSNSKNIERILFWWAKIKTCNLSKNVKIDPQEYVLQGFSLPLLSTKTPKT